MVKKILEAIKSCDAAKMSLVFKCVTIILCFIGFACQIKDFIIQFYSYPTVLNIEVQKSDVFLKPAVTVCSNNPVKRSLFCLKYPHKCEKIENLTSLCKERSYFCNNKDMFDFMMPKTEEFEHHYKKLMTMEDWATLLPQREEFIHREIFSWGEKFEGPFFFNSFRPDTNGNVKDQFSCFTANSRILGDAEALHVPFDQEADKEDNKPDTSRVWIGTFELNSEEDEQSDDYEPRSFISVHSPFNFDDPLETLIPLETGKMFEVFIRLEKEIHLPHPYKTDCIDYEEMWRNRNKTGPRSRQVCLRLCTDQFEWRCRNCSEAIWESLPHRCIGMRRNMCTEKETQQEMEKVKICRSSCKNECTKYKYPFKIIGRNHKSVRWRDKYGRHLTKVNMHIDEPEILVYQHIPKYIQVELFSNIGGILGIWLGVSIWSTSYTLFKYPIVFFHICVEKINSMRNSV